MRSVFVIVRSRATGLYFAGGSEPTASRDQAVAFPLRWWIRNPFRLPTEGFDLEPASEEQIAAFDAAREDAA